MIIQVNLYNDFINFSCKKILNLRTDFNGEFFLRSLCDQRQTSDYLVVIKFFDYFLQTIFSEI